MALLHIVRYPDPVLREKAREVTRITPNLKRMVQNMAETMYDAKGIGLAAPQIGISKRVVIVDLGEGLTTLINPVIVKTSGKQRGKEGCLSFPGLWGDVDRAESVEVRGLDLNGEEIYIAAQGYLARALQHEIDHLDGIVFTDRAVDVYKE